MDGGPPACGTRVWRGSCELDVAHAARTLAAGRLVAFPTETVYGLGADATNAVAVRNIFIAKGRPADNPLIVHLASAAALSAFTFTPPLSPPAERLAAAFWPGPLTLVLPLSEQSTLAEETTGGVRSVGVRVPRHPVAAALLAAARVPVAAPSANISGRPSPTRAGHVLADLGGRIAGVLAGDDDEPATHHLVGLESTVVDATDPSQLVVLRPGALSRAQLAAVARVPVLQASASAGREGGAPKAPGMKYRHYAPSAPLRVVPRAEMLAAVREACMCAGGGLVGVLADAELCRELADVSGVRIVPCGRRGDALSAAQGLYAALRTFDQDEEPAQLILAAALEDAADGLAAAFMNRLRKAESGGDVGTLGMSREKGAESRPDRVAMASGADQ